MSSIACPRCGFVVHIMCLTSNPPQYEAGCSRGCFHLKYYNRKDSFKYITQEEIDELFNDGPMERE